MVVMSYTRANKKFPFVLQNITIIYIFHFSYCYEFVWGSNLVSLYNEISWMWCSAKTIQYFRNSSNTYTWMSWILQCYSKKLDFKNLLHRRSNKYEVFKFLFCMLLNLINLIIDLETLHIPKFGKTILSNLMMIITFKFQSKIFEFWYSIHNI